MATTIGVALLSGGSLSNVDATAASVLVAVVLGVVTFVQQRQAQRRQHTVDLITTMLSAERIAEAVSRIGFTLAGIGGRRCYGYGRRAVGGSTELPVVGVVEPFEA